MKKNKSNMKKNLLIAGMALMIILIPVAVWFFTKTPGNDFMPVADSDTSFAAVATWEESVKTEDKASIPTDSDTPDVIPGTPDDNTQVIVSDEDSEIISNLTVPEDTEAPKEKLSKKPAEKPKASTPSTDSSAPPSYDTSVPQAPVKETKKETKNNTKKETKKDISSSSKKEDHSGQVYDPVFGWVDVGPTQCDIIYSDGDIDEQVGYMGEE